MATPRRASARSQESVGAWSKPDGLPAAKTSSVSYEARSPTLPSAATLTPLDAATVAVHWSKARNRGTAVDVSYTPRKWVKKPRGAKPGLVQISNEKTIRAGNDPERLKRILSTGRREDSEGDDA